MKSSKNRIKEFKELLILIIVALTVKTCLIEIYVVPTGSMENTILIGDMLIGNKFIYGMRTPDWIGIPYTRIGFYIPSFRLPKFKDIKNDDVVIETSKVNVIIDDTSLNFINGSKIDYVTELIGSSFKITNPQASSSCGCGTSFSI